MAEVKVSDQIAASATSVWALIRDFGDLSKWAAGIESCEVSGEGIGAVRTLGLPGGGTLKERLEAFDEEARSFSYSMVEPIPLPLKNYLATVTLSEEGPDRCGIEWSSSFEPSGASEEQTVKMIQGIYLGGIASIKKKLGS